MSRLSKLLDQILKGTSDKNIPFKDLLTLLEKLGFTERVKGSHHIFSKSGVLEIINLQATSENKCKPYQVKQVRELIVKYKLSEIF